MAATFEATGTWTPVTTILAETSDGNVPGIKNEAYPDFATPIPEIYDLVQLVADGYSTSEVSVPFWKAANFLRQQLTCLFNGEAPRAKNVG